jgi:hypothetical protein
MTSSLWSKNRYRSSRIILPRGLAHRRHAMKSLLRSVLLRDCSRASQFSPSGLYEFEGLEPQISFVDIIGTGDHAIVYHITAGGRTFALKLVCLSLVLLYDGIY